jgi:thymidine phosphorylase
VAHVRDENQLRAAQKMLRDAIVIGEGDVAETGTTGAVRERIVAMRHGD